MTFAINLLNSVGGSSILMLKAGMLNLTDICEPVCAQGGSVTLRSSCTLLILTAQVSKNGGHFKKFVQQSPSSLDSVAAPFYSFFFTKVRPKFNCVRKK